MNPYLVEWMGIHEKMAAHHGNNEAGVNPYIREAVKTGMKIREWDDQRKTAVKESNNDSISEISINIDDDDDHLVMVLCPRIKLIYNRKAGPILNPLTLAYTLRMLLILPNYSKIPVFIDLDDVRSADYCKTIEVYIRDFSFIPHLDNNIPIYSKVEIARKYLLLSNLNPLTVLYDYVPNLVYELVGPPHADPECLLRRFDNSYPGYMFYRRPMMVVYGLVPAFPSTSNKSTHLYKFFSFFGTVRSFDIQLDTVSIEYQVEEEFLVALKTLSCCSIRKGGSHELFEFDIVLNPDLGEKEKELDTTESTFP